MKIPLPELSLVVLIGPSGAGKSSFCRKHFLTHEVLSSDFCRGLVSNDENNQAASNDAFDVLHYIGAKRLTRGLLTVIDATNVQEEARRPLVSLAREHDVLPVAIVLNLPPKLCEERNASRPDRNFGEHVIRQQVSQLRRSLRGLKREGFRHIFELNTAEEIEAAQITREPLWNNKKTETGPFDIIGDIHGCYDELVTLLEKLGYDTTEHGRIVPPTPGRKVVFLGDLVDRGPKVVEVLFLVRSMVKQGIALCVPGNHDVKLLKKLQGKNVKIAHGLAETLEQLEAKTTPEERGHIAQFLDSLVSHYLLDGGKLVVAHAGMKERYQGRGSGRVRDFALYGETTGETDEFGLPIRHNWAAEYEGRASVVYGHTPVPEAEWLNRTLNIDTGCVFGGKLTALRWPEKEIVSVPALKTYAEPIRPLTPVATPLSAQQLVDDVLDVSQVLGKKIINTRLIPAITVREENAAAALEVMSRFAIHPKWLIYLPPTMSPPETSALPGLLEHPVEAFNYFKTNGVDKVICEQKHMGSRAVVIVCKDEDATRTRFGIENDGAGIIYTRTGRRFFEDRTTETALLDRIRSAATAAGLWEELNTTWLCLDCELMPWSAKAQELLENQYAPVGAAGRAVTTDAVRLLLQAQSRGIDTGALLTKQTERATAIENYITAYRQYCWPVKSIDDLKIAPFHLLASEGAVHTDKDHLWHLRTLARLSEITNDPILMATAHKVVDLNDEASIAEGTQWWTDLTTSGGEGMVVKPLSFLARGPKGLVQPAIKCRGREYLRIIYGPEYTSEENLKRLRSRAVGGKRGLASREFALGIEALERFVRREPLRDIHQCVFAVLALESEPIDPRL